MKVAIIGMGNSEGDAPWRDPAWERWALPWHPYAWHAQRLFEMHPLPLVVRPEARRPPDYWERLREVGQDGIPLYLQRLHPSLESGVAYPLDAIKETVFADFDEDEDYYGSSPAYMLALAIHEEIEHIGIWGVDLKESIYDHQRPNLEYLIGFARGRGLRVDIHPDSRLLTLKQHDKIGDLEVYYPERYGWVA